MGGGGGFIPPSKPLNELLRERFDRESQDTYLQSVNAYLGALLSNFNDRDTNQIQTHLVTIKTALEKDIDGSLELNFGGSISKHTYASGLSDIDMLVNLNDSSLAELSPKEVLSYFESKLKQRLPNSKITIGQLAVTVEFTSGHEIQLLPSISTQTGVRIARPNENEWSNVVHPDLFARKLTQVNQTNKSKVVPIIKLFKGMNDTLPKSLQLSGYHIESIAINAFKDYRGKKASYHDMLQHFCNYAKQAVLSPINDSTGQSVHVDDYLGSSGSIHRRQINKALERLSNRISRADTQKSIEQWGEFFD